MNKALFFVGFKNKKSKNRCFVFNQLHGKLVNEFLLHCVILRLLGHSEDSIKVKIRNE